MKMPSKTAPGATTPCQNTLLEINELTPAIYEYRVSTWGVQDWCTDVGGIDGHAITQIAVALPR